MRSNKSFAIVAVTAALTSAAAGSAFAQIEEAAPSTTVRIADLDLNSPNGAKLALSRIERAAEFVCGGQPGLGDFGRRSDYDRCRGVAIDKAVKSLDRPVLNQLASLSTPAMLVAVR